MVIIHSHKLMIRFKNEFTCSRNQYKLAPCKVWVLSLNSFIDMDFKRRVIHELHKPARKNFPRRNTVLKGNCDLYQSDLVEMIPHSKINRGYKYILTLINCFSKMAYAQPLKTKTGREISEAMELILKKNKLEFKHLQTDKGKEYYNNIFSNLMDKYNINHYSTNSEKKAGIIERFNRTLKSAMYKEFSMRGSYKWIDILSKLIENYNNRFHRSIGMKPTQVNSNNERLVLKNIEHAVRIKPERIPPSKFNEGDQVRISKYKGVFTKGYLPNWSNEVFEIFRVQPTNPVTYILRASNGEIIEGGFYGHELLKSNTGNVYLIQKIIKRKGDKYLVRWLGFDKSQDSWVTKSELLQ